VSRNIIVVLGPGRSGTSLLTRVLHSLGMAEGAYNDTTGVQNPEGDYEDVDIAKVHLEILDMLGVHPNLPLDDHLFLDEKSEIYVKKLIRVLNDKLDKAVGVWGFKDPKTSLLLPLWIRAFNKLNIVPRFVLAVRDPWSCSVSRKTNYFTSESLGELIWLDRVSASLYYTGGRCFIVHYEQWFQGNPEKIVKELADYCGLDSSEENLSAALGGINPDLNRSVGKGVVKNKLVNNLYEVLASREGELSDCQSVLSVAYECRSEMNCFSGWYDEANRHYRKKNKSNKRLASIKNEGVEGKGTESVLDKLSVDEKKIDGGFCHVSNLADRESCGLISAKADVLVSALDEIAKVTDEIKKLRAMLAAAETSRLRSVFSRYVSRARKLLRKDKLLEYCFALFYRVFESFFVFSRRNNKTWLISERLGKSIEENGLWFFYWCKKNNPEISAFYILEKDVALPDWIVRDSSIVKRGGLRHFWLLLRASAVFFTNDPRDSALIRTDFFLSKVKTVFLRHGVGIYSNGKYLQREAGKIDLVCCVSDLEKDILSEKVEGGAIDSFVVTGQPRFDALYGKVAEEKIILFCPTWRYALDKEKDAGVVKSDYFKAIQSLLRSERLHGLLEKHDAIMKVRLHFRLSNVLRILEAGGRVSVERTEVRLQDSLISSSLLITDYSSIMWDMAYMYKPVILYQFDRDDFLRERSRTSFNLRDDEMFSDFAFREDELIDKVEAYLESGFDLEETRRDRIQRAFSFNDARNCERIYSAVMRLF